MRILVIEDEADLRHQLVNRLQEEHYAVDAAGDGEEGLFLGGEYPFDVAVVDLGLPKRSGIDVIRCWRQRERNFPVLILTARSRWQEKVAGLEAGADDYLVKPFHMEELLARINSLLRRGVGQARPEVVCGPFTLDTARQQLSVNGRLVVLTAYEYKALEYLMLHQGEVISKTELTEHLYDQDFYRDSNVIEVFIGRLRRKLDPNDSLHPIETLRGRGYRFAVPPG